MYVLTNTCMYLLIHVGCVLGKRSGSTLCVSIDAVSMRYILTSCWLYLQNLYSRVPGCQITTYYYVGFVYMMMRRYQDAIRTFSNILLYIQRTKSMFQNKAQLYDQVKVCPILACVLLASLC